jgi:hypothetical protein
MLDQYPQRSTQSAFRVIQGQAFIATVGDGRLYLLNRVGTLIWEMADGSVPLRDIVAEVCNRFEVQTEQATADAIRFVEKLRQRGLLSVSDHPV